MPGHACLFRLILPTVTVLLCLAQRPGAAAANPPQGSISTIAEEVSFRSGVIALSGTLIKPATAGPHPAVVLVHGSSPNVRDPLLGFATEVFAEHGVAALAYDKRGYGKSAGNPSKNSLYSLADDALAAVRYLQSRADIDPKRVGMEGESQGGWIIPIAASRGRDIAFMVLVSASGVSPAQQGVFDIEQHLRKAGYAERFVDMGRKARKLEDDLAYGLNHGQLPAPGGVADVFSLGTDFEPVPVLEQLSQPVLVFLGESDAYVPAAYSAYIFEQAFKKAGNPDYTIIVYPGADHGIETPTTNAQGQEVMTKVNGYWDTMANWVLAHVNSTATPGQIVQGRAADESAAFNDAGIYGKPAWFGTAAVQLALIALFVLVFSGSMLGGSIGALILRTAAQDTRRSRMLAMAASALNFIVLALVVAFLVEVVLNGEEMNVAVMYDVLPILALLAAALNVMLCVDAALAWKHRTGSEIGRLAYSMLALVAVLFILFLGYWNLLGLWL
jgi:pimeloyl-ACP methyl ester carboxylesterase